MAQPVSLAFRIAANLTELRANLAEGRAEMETTKAAMTAMANGFDGSKIIASGNAMVKVITDLGGASTLTGAEQARVNATLTAAIEKYQALGKTAPEGMIALANATKQTKPPLDESDGSLKKMLGTLNGIAGVLGVAFSIQAIGGFVKGVFDSAGKVKDLSVQLDLSTDAVQGFKFAAEQGGATLDAVGQAISKMNQLLAGGSLSTQRALKDAGLEFDTIRSMRPEDAFLAITDAVKTIPDPMERTRVAVELLGKGAADLLPAIMAGFRETADAATKMSKQTVERLAEAKNAWDKLGTGMTVTTGSMIAKAMEWQQGLSSGARGVFLALYETLGIVEKLPPAQKKIAEQAEVPIPVDPLVAYREKLRDLQQGVTQLNGAEIDLIIQGDKLNQSVTEMAAALRLDEAAVHAVVDAEKKREDQLKKSIEIDKRAAEQTVKLRNDLIQAQLYQGGTAHDIEMARIRAWETEQVAALTRAGTATAENLKLISEAATEMREGVGIDFDYLRSISRDTAVQQRDDALATYQYMQQHADQFTRGAMDAQVQKYRDLAFAATASGRAAADGQNEATEATKKHTESLTEQFLAISKLQAAEAAQMNGAPVSQDVTSQNFERIIRAYQTNSGWNPTGAGSGIEPNQAFAWARLGYSLQEILTMFDRQKRGMTGALPPPQGPRIPGFETGVRNAPGGWAMVGERGPEVMYVPPRADIYPNGAGPASGGVAVSIVVQGHLIGASEQELGGVLMAALMAKLRSSGTRLPLGV